jgi:hypothetical protein
VDEENIAQGEQKEVEVAGELDCVCDCGSIRTETFAIAIELAFGRG